MRMTAARQVVSSSGTSLKISWKRPLTYILIPAAILLALVGVLPPFPPARPTKPAQEQAAPYLAAGVVRETSFVARAVRAITASSVRRGAGCAHWPDLDGRQRTGELMVPADEFGSPTLDLPTG